MGLLIRDARVVAGDRILPRASVLVSGGRIARIARRVPRPARAELIEARGLLLAPGLIDIHINGGFRRTFSAASVEQIHAVSVALLRLGVTGYLPTLLSLPPSRTKDALRRIAEAARLRGGARILGAHLEGPYLSPVRRGAHLAGHLRRPSLGEFRSLLDASPGLVRMVTIAPELPGAEEIIRCGRKRGVLMCAGHTDATADELERGVNAGIRHVTHLYNAMRPFHHRAEGIIDRSLLDDRLSCEIIYDRRHLSRSAVELLLRCKPMERVILVSDATLALGAPSGSYRAEGARYDVRGGTIRVAQSSLLAGSAISLRDAARNLAADFRLPLPRVIAAAAGNPARALGLRRGRIAPGWPADLVLFDKRWGVKTAIVGGKRWK